MILIIQARSLRTTLPAKLRKALMNALREEGHAFGKDLLWQKIKSRNYLID
jgi:hypothetical protein